MTIHDRIGFQFSFDNKDITLKETKSPEKAAIFINHKGYKLQGNREAVSLIRSCLKQSHFESTNQFKVCLQESLGLESKELVIFQRTFGGGTTVEEKRLKQWLKAFSSLDSEKIRHFYSKMVTPPSEKIFAEDIKNAETSQGLRLVSISSLQPGKVEAVVQEECGFHQYLKITMEIELDAPHRVLEMSIKPTSHERVPAPRMTSEAAAIAAIRAKVKEAAQADQFSGVLMITKRGNPKALIAEPYGLANRATEVQNSLGTQFNLASMSKMFTTVGILQLREKGELKLNDPIEKYLKSEITNEDMQKVTIRQLLTHTGGTGRIEGDFRSNTHPKQYIEVSKDRAPSFPPGTQWEYSNYGMVLLGAIIENVAKQDYYEYIQEKIFDRVGMRDSNFQKKDELNERTAIGYIEKRRGFLENGDVLPMKGTPAGGGFSTVGDLTLFSEALLNGTLISQESLELIQTAVCVANDPEPSYYAIGFMTGDNWFGHSGRYEGVNGELRIFPESDYVVAMLANRDPEAASDLVEFITDTLPTTA